MSTSAETNFSWVPSARAYPRITARESSATGRNHLTPDQARRLDDMCREKLTPVGLSFPISE